MANMILTRYGARPLDFFLRKEDLTSQVDGITDAFLTGDPYVAGSLEVYLDGVLQNAVIGYVTEDDPTTGAFSLGSVPLIGQTVYVHYNYQE